MPPREAPITVAIADDQALLRAGFRVIVETEPDMTVVGEAGDGHVAVDVVRGAAPRRRAHGHPHARARRPAAPRSAILGDPGLETAVLMLTTFDTREYVYDALRLGASGFLLKDAPAARLLDAIRVAAAGDALLEPSITRRLIEQFARVAAPTADDGAAGGGRLADRARAGGAAPARARHVERRDRRRARPRRARP